MTQNIEGKVVVITGASSGLGEATARHLAAAGAKLVLGARRLDRLQALADGLRLGGDAALQTDVTDREQVRALVDHAVAKHGRLDVMINNAGLMPHSPLERCKVEDWNRMIDVWACSTAPRGGDQLIQLRALIALEQFDHARDLRPLAGRRRSWRGHIVPGRRDIRCELRFRAAAPAPEPPRHQAN